jgi:hypothetical protein
MPVPHSREFIWCFGSMGNLTRRALCGMAGLGLFNQKIAVAVTMPFKFCIRHRKNGLLNRPLGLVYQIFIPGSESDLRPGGFKTGFSRVKFHNFLAQNAAQKLRPEMA